MKKYIIPLISLGAGLGMVIRPEATPKFIIMGIGVVWILEGATDLIAMYKDRLKCKVKDKK